jgi:hypothetical protein
VPTLATILNDLVADPETFLRHYFLFIGGGQGTTSGVATFVCELPGNTVTGFTTGLSGILGLTKDREKIKFRKVAIPPRTQLGTDEFDAWYIAMTELGSNAQTTHFPLPGNSGPDLMLTSQLSGCTVGIGSGTTSGSRLVSHIQPPSGELDEDTLTRMHDDTVNRMTDGFDAVFERANQPGARHYGDARNRATVVGVRRGNAWEFWAQEYRNMNYGNEILSVRHVA